MPTTPTSAVFRPNLALGLSLSAAALLWLGVFAYLLTLEGVPQQTLASTSFFVAFFWTCVVYYWRTVIIVEPSGVTYRGMVRTEHFRYGDISNVDVLPGPITVYCIRTRGRRVHFTSFFRNHRRLLSLLVERARLSPRAV